MQGWPLTVGQRSTNHFFHFKALHQLHMGMRHRRYIGAVRNKRIAPRFSIVSNWKTRPRQGQHPRAFLVAKPIPFWSDDAQIMSRNIVPNANGVQNKFPIMIWMLSAKCEELHAGNVRAGPTIDRRSRRYATSILCKSFQYTVRCPAAKRAVGEMTRSKYSSVWSEMTRRFRRLFSKSKAFNLHEHLPARSMLMARPWCRGLGPTTSRVICSVGMKCGLRPIYTVRPLAEMLSLRTFPVTLPNPNDQFHTWGSSK